MPELGILANLEWNAATQRGLLGLAEADDWIKKLTSEDPGTQSGDGNPLAHREPTAARHQDLKAQLLGLIIERAIQYYAAEVKAVENKISKAECLLLTTMTFSMLSCFAAFGFFVWEIWAMENCLKPCENLDCTKNPIIKKGVNKNTTWCTTTCPSSACPPPHYVPSGGASWGLIGPSGIASLCSIVGFIGCITKKISGNLFEDCCQCCGWQLLQPPQQRGFFSEDLIQAIVILAQQCPNAEEVLAPLQPFRIN